MPLLPKLMSYKELRDADEHLSDHALISLAMYGRASSPCYAGIWVPHEPFSDDEKAPVRKRTFELDWTSSTIKDHAKELRYPTLVGITAWEYEIARSLLVFEQHSEPRTSPDVVTEEAPGDLANAKKGRQGRTVSGLDMCLERTATPTTEPPFYKEVAKETYVAVIQPAPELPAPPAPQVLPPRTMFYVQRLQSVKDKLDGLDSFEQHRAALRGWSRGHHAIPLPKNIKGGRRQVAVHYQDDTFKKWPNDITAEFRCGTPIEGPIKPSQIHARIDHGEALGYWPLRVGANGFGEHTRFFITWARRGKLYPLKRYDAVVDGVDPTPRRMLDTTYTVSSSATQLATSSAGASQFTGSSPATQSPGTSGGSSDPATNLLKQIDNIVLKKMHGQGAHAAQIAVAKDGMLKLVRSYTFAERNWPVTNAHHRLRWASVAKLLMGMRACVQSQDFLEEPIAAFLPDLPLILTNPEASGKLLDLLATRLIDLLRYQSGWQDDNTYEYYQKTIDYGFGQVPLLPGDFGRFITHSNLEFISKPPATREIYNNFNFIAAAEVLAKRLKGNAAKYVDLMLEYWQIGNEDLRERIGPIPATRNECLAAGEPPIRSVPSGMRGTLGGKAYPMANGDPCPWVPNAYRQGGDGEFAAGSGYFTMSAAMLARILQGMHPAPALPVKQLLTRDERDRMLQANPAALDSKGDPATKGLGPSFDTITFAGNPATLRIIKEGSMPGSTSGSKAVHYVWGPPADEHHLTVVGIIVGSGELGIYNQVEALEELGYWDSDVNLFPEFFGA